MFLYVHFPTAVGLEDELIYISLRMLPSFCNTETVNSRVKKKSGVGNCLAKSMALCLKKRKKIPLIFLAI